MLLFKDYTYLKFSFIYLLNNIYYWKATAVDFFFLEIQQSKILFLYTEKCVQLWFWRNWVVKSFWKNFVLSTLSQDALQTFRPPRNPFWMQITLCMDLFLIPVLKLFKPVTCLLQMCVYRLVYHRWPQSMHWCNKENFTIPVP